MGKVLSLILPENPSPNVIVPDGTTYQWTVTDNPNVIGQSPLEWPTSGGV